MSKKSPNKFEFKLSMFPNEIYEHLSEYLNTENRKNMEIVSKTFIPYRVDKQEFLKELTSGKDQAYRDKFVMNFILKNKLSSLDVKDIRFLFDDNVPDYLFQMIVESENNKKKIVQGLLDFMGIDKTIFDEIIEELKFYKKFNPFVGSTGVIPMGYISNAQIQMIRTELIRRKKHMLLLCKKLHKKVIEFMREKYDYQKKFFVYSKYEKSRYYFHIKLMELLLNLIESQDNEGLVELVYMIFRIIISDSPMGLFNCEEIMDVYFKSVYDYEHTNIYNKIETQLNKMLKSQN